MFGVLSSYLFLIIFPAEKIEKRLGNRKPRGRYDGNLMKIEFDEVSWSFMSLFSHSPKIISYL